MNDRQFTVFQAFQRVQAFGQTHSTDFPAGSRGATYFAIIGTAVAGLKDASAQPGSSASPATALKSDVIDTVREDLKAIARTARAIEEADGPAGFAVPFTLPRERSNRDLIAAARSILATLEGDSTLAAHFIAYDIPADFVTDLRQDLATYDAATTEQAEDRSDGVGSTAATLDNLAQGKAALFQLNTIAQNKYRTNPALLAAWRTAAHINRASGGANPPPPQTPPVTPPPPAT